MNNLDKLQAKGIVTINTYESGTENLLDSYCDKNTITIEGITEIINRILTNSGTSDAIVTRLVLGDDAGTGTLLSPSAAQPTLSGSDQSQVYEVRTGDLQIGSSGSRRIVASAVMYGSDIMNNEFPTDIVLNFCSATLRFENGVALAYKRFPVRSLSRLVDITITWEIELFYQ